MTDMQTETWVDELKVLATLSWPVCVTNLLAYTIQVVGQAFVGRLGADYLAASALGNSYFNMIWYFIQGVSTALDTLASQAYGSGDTELVKLWSLRAAVVLSVVFIPAFFTMWYSAAIMINLFGLPVILCIEAQTYVRWLIPGTFFWAMFLCLQKFQQSQNQMVPSMLFALLANLINAMLNYVFVFGIGWGYPGSPMATSIARFFMVLGLLAYVCLTPAPLPPKGAAGGVELRKALLSDGNGASSVGKRPRCGDSLNMALLKKVLEWTELRKFINLGVQGGVMMALEAWMFEVMTIFAGHLGNIPLGAHNILLVVAGFFYLSFPLGISIACTIRVGNLLGASDGPRARRAALITLFAGSVFMGVAGVLIYIFKDDIGLIFSNTPSVVNLVARLAPLYVIFSIVDGFQGVAGGVLRGLGMQGRIAVMNFFGFWMVGVPTGGLLCFKAHLGVFGLWWGLCTGIFAICALYFFFLARINWQAEAVIASERAKAAGSNISGTEATVFGKVNIAESAHYGSIK